MNKTIDPIWEEKYNLGLAQYYPWDVIVSFIYKNAPKNKPRAEIKILEIGCGSAPNLWFAAREGFCVTGIDGSKSAIELARKRFEREGLTGDFIVSDFTKTLPLQDNHYDFVIDRGSITCVGIEAGLSTIGEILRVLKPEGKFFFNPYSDRHSSAISGQKGNDGLTINISEGSMTNVGQICFYSKKDVLKAVERFEIISLNHIEQMDMSRPSYEIHAEWRLVLKKPI